jgi:hypothetical protein
MMIIPTQVEMAAIIFTFAIFSSGGDGGGATLISEVGICLHVPICNGE